MKKRPRGRHHPGINPLESRSLLSAASFSPGFQPLAVPSPPHPTTTGPPVPPVGHGVDPLLCLPDLQDEFTSVIRPVPAAAGRGEPETIVIDVYMMAPPPASDVPRASPSVRELADDVLEHPDAWLDTPNSWFGGRKPRDLIGTEEEVKVYNVLRAVDLGLF